MDNKVYGYIYIITNDLNNKVYVGQTSETIDSRFKRHCRDKKSGKTFGTIDYDIQHLGKEHFIITEIEKISISDLDERESYWIDYYDSFFNGYNKTLGGQGGRKYTEKQIIEGLKLYQNGVPLNEIEKEIGISKSTLNKYRINQNIKKRSPTEHERRVAIDNFKKATLVRQISIENITLHKIYSSKKEALCDMINLGYSNAKDWHNIRAPLDKALRGEQKTFLNFEWRYITDEL